MPKNQPLVSLLMANYNNGAYIEEAIKSVLNQTYTNWEIIIVDDASTDNSLMVIEQIANKYDNIRIYRNEKNLKVALTKAKATEYAKGEICAILDPDDALAPNAIEKHVETYLKYPDCSLVSSKYFLCDAQLNVEGINTDVFNPETNYSYLASSGGINAFWSFKKDKYIECSGFDKEFPLAEDQDLYYKLEEVGIIKVIDEPLYYYRIHKRSISKNDNLATAYAYHLLAMFEAKNRRPKNRLESKAIKAALLHFMTWGIMKIKKPMRIQLFGKMLVNFPHLLLNKSVISAILGLFKSTSL